MTDPVVDPAPRPRHLEDIQEADESGGRRKRFSDMAADVLSPRSEPAGLASPTSNRTSLPPLVTSPPSKAKLERASSYINKRISTFSTTSNTQSVRSRPASTAFPIFHSSLPYTLVRDFAYGPLHPLFYGPLPDSSDGMSTPASEVSRRLSDPPSLWPADRGWSTQWEASGEQLPPTSYGDGPPYSEDDDIHSPVVTSARHKKHKSNVVDFDHTRGRRAFVDEPRRASYSGTNGDGGHVFYVSDANEAANGPGGEYITYPPADPFAQSRPEADAASQHDAHTLPQSAYSRRSADSDEEMSEADDVPQGASRFSRDYQFTIASPEEEMHGKAVALFDFARENDNELPLVEGQVILVSYRHGQGWLVAQDSKTGESGLVPETYVRLLRDIEGGWNGLMNGAELDSAAALPDGLLSPLFAGPEAKTPTQADHSAGASASAGSAHRLSTGGERYTPVISTFSTSTKDLEPYPKDLLGTPTNADASGSERPRSCSSDRGEDDGADDDGADDMEGVEMTPPPEQRQSQQPESEGGDA